MKEVSGAAKNNILAAIDNPIDMQIFKTDIYNNDVAEAIYRHKMSIFNAVVYGVFYMRPIPNTNGYRYCFSGFHEQNGRLPEERDKIMIIRGRYYFDRVNDSILSEVWIELEK